VASLLTCNKKNLGFWVEVFFWDDIISGVCFRPFGLGLPGPGLQLLDGIYWLMGHSISKLRKKWKFVTLCLRISLFLYISLLFQNDDQKKEFFQYLRRFSSYSLLKFSPLGGDLPCKHSFLLIGQCKFACSFINTLHRRTKIGFSVLWRAKNPSLQSK